MEEHMFVMLVSIRVNPAFLDAFIDITRYNARASRAEPGVVRFDFFQDRDHPDTFKLLELIFYFLGFHHIFSHITCYYINALLLLQNSHCIFAQI